MILQETPQKLCHALATETIAVLNKLHILISSSLMQITRALLMLAGDLIKAMEMRSHATLDFQQHCAAGSIELIRTIYNAPEETNYSPGAIELILF